MSCSTEAEKNLKKALTWSDSTSQANALVGIGWALLCIAEQLNQIANKRTPKT